MTVTGDIAHKRIELQEVANTLAVHKERTLEELRSTEGMLDMLRRNHGITPTVDG